MKTKTVNGTYGSENTPAEIYVLETRSGLSWYVVDGSITVNCTYEEINEGVHVEDLQDIDCFTWSEPIESEEELENAYKS